MKNNHIKFLASFMITLILTLPLYSASVLGQFEDLSTLPDPVQSCIDKNEKTNALVELMDNEIISTLEKILSTMRIISSIWENVKGVYNGVILVLYHLGKYDTAAEREETRGIKDFEEGGLAVIRYMVTCEIPGVGQLGICGAKLPGGIEVGPFDNIYTAVGCLCLPAILSNMKQLQLIYKTHNCCVQQACNNGFSPEVCEQQFEETTCLYYGKGAVIQGLLGIGLGILTRTLMPRFIEEKTGEQSPFFGTIVSLARVALRIQSLISSFQKLQDTIQEQTCEDLNFGDLKNNVLQQQRTIIEELDCRFVPIDSDNNGIFEDLIYICED